LQKILKIKNIIYHKNKMDDILYINKSFEIKICENIKYKIKSYIWSDKILNWDYYIFQSEIYEDTKDTSKRIISIRKCIELQWWISKYIFKSFRWW